MADCQFLLVQVAGERLAVRFHQVVEVRMRDSGAQDARPVLDLGDALGLARAGARPGYELVVRTPRGVASWAIDRACEVLAVPEETLLPLPPLARGLAAARGIEEGLVLEGRVVLVVDAGRIQGGR